MKYDQLKLSNQVCFPLYTASRLFTKEYQPYLSKLGITYPQYLVLLVLWETDELPVNEIARKLLLNTNTITPLLQRMESEGILVRERSGNDERKVIVSLTKKGRKMKEKAASIPIRLVSGLDSEKFTIKEITELRNKLNLLIEIMKENA
jgi:MarR family transcriptional regulator, organic hydroperoxide resistance regulator